MSRTATAGARRLAKRSTGTHKCMCPGKCAVKGKCVDLLTPATKKLRCLSKKAAYQDQGKAAFEAVKSAQAAVNSAQKGVSAVKNCNTYTGGTCNVQNCYSWRKATCKKINTHTQVHVPWKMRCERKMCRSPKSSTQQAE